MTSKLHGTVALVTGASSGIGASTARLLAEHGASVALVARRLDRLDALAAEIEEAGGTALAVVADISDRAQAEAAVEQVVARFGRLDILVNNTGLMLLGPVVGADVDEWERMLATNVRGLLYTTRAALPHLLKAAEEGPRHVADISSIAGGVATELASHNRPEIQGELTTPFYEQTEVLAPEDIADGVAFMVTRPRHTAVAELWIMPTDQV
jgi:NADP-dependent 3-hydroxy acid dehydrogenase YdfG